MHFNAFKLTFTNILLLLTSNKAPKISIEMWNRENVFETEDRLYIYYLHVCKWDKDILYMLIVLFYHHRLLPMNIMTDENVENTEKVEKSLI